MKRHDTTGEPGNSNRSAVMPEKKARKKQRDFFALWSSLMDASGDADHDPLWSLCDEIFKNEYPDGKEGMKWLESETAKILDKKAAEKMKNGVEELTTKFKYFYLAVGFALRQDFDVSRPDVREQIQYLRKRVREAGIFPLIARRKQI